MGTVAKKNGYNLIIRTNDHTPPHTHVLKSGGEALFYLGSLTEKPQLRENRGLTLKEAKEALKLVIEYQEDLLKKWEEYHG